MAEVSAPPTNPRQVLLRGDFTPNKMIEGKVAATKTVIPGMLVEKVAAGDYPYGDYQPHATAGGFAEKLVCMKGMVADIPYSPNALKTGGVDDTFVAGDHLFILRCDPGDELWMFLKASGSAVVLADFLESGGTGDLQKATSTNARLFKPLETKTPAATRTRCRVRAL